MPRRSWLLLLVLALACGCGERQCGKASPASDAEVVPRFSPATPPELLLVQAPVHDVRAIPEGLVLLTASTWNLNPTERAIELRPRGGGPARRLARTAPLAWLLGTLGGEVIWTERNEADSRITYSLHAVPLAGGPARALDPQGLLLDDGLAIDRGRVLGRGSPSVGVLLALPLTGAPPEVVAHAAVAPIRSRAQLLRSACDIGVGKPPAVRAGDDLFVASSTLAADVAEDLRLTYDRERTVILCKVGAGGTFDVVTSRSGDKVTLLGADGDKVVAAIDGELKIFDQGRESSRAALPATAHIDGFAVAAGEIFVLVDRTIYRLRAGADRFEKFFEDVQSFLVDGDRVIARMIDGVAAVPLGSTPDAGK